MKATIDLKTLNYCLSVIKVEKADKNGDFGN
jgi:hypothetical protein